MTKREFNTPFKGARILSGILAAHFISITDVAFANDYPAEPPLSLSKKTKRKLTGLIYRSLKRYHSDFFECALDLLTKEDWAVQLPILRQIEFEPIGFHDDLHNFILADLFCDAICGDRSKKLIAEIERDEPLSSESTEYIDTVIDYIVDQFIGGHKIQSSSLGVKFDVV